MYQLPQACQGITLLLDKPIIEMDTQLKTKSESKSESESDNDNDNDTEIDKKLLSKKVIKLQ